LKKVIIEGTARIHTNERRPAVRISCDSHANPYPTFTILDSLIPGDLDVLKEMKARLRKTKKTTPPIAEPTQLTLPS
jgi:thiamine pyrophosphokinase